MKTGKKIIIISSAVLNVILLYFLLSKSGNIDRKPYWHPFELNSNLTLKSIVENGYSFESMPCGQVQYTKRIADTIIQYEIMVDCKEYKGKYVQEHNFYEENTEEVLNSNEIKNIKYLEEEIAENKYYPWNLNEIKDCYQEINWRVYTINLGKELDLEKVREFIYEKGGYFTMENWNEEKGGSAMVYYRENSLFFNVSVNKQEFLDKDTWVFNIIRTIPYLDANKNQKNTEQTEKRNKYYE